MIFRKEILMFLIYGFKQFASKRVSFRNDFCLSCNSQVIAERVKTFLVMTFFFIPLLPLGFRRYWLCTCCGNAPKQSPLASKVILKIGAGLFLAVGVLMLLAFIIENDYEIIGLPLGFIAFGLFCLSLLYLDKSRGLYKEMIQTIEPYNDLNCPFCETELVLSKPASCPLCHITKA